MVMCRSESPDGSGAGSVRALTAYCLSTRIKASKQNDPVPWSVAIPTYDNIEAVAVDW